MNRAKVRHDIKAIPTVTIDQGARSTDSGSAGQQGWTFEHKKTNKRMQEEVRLQMEKALLAGAGTPEDQIEKN
ncbi:MAG: hypothetical protein NPIRA06_27870 [Nitrospirales bacterium]|nr:MAG: hypothetical protein NPIRA06_27870 [Nitrospirales bacterium]